MSFETATPALPGGLSEQSASEASGVFGEEFKDSLWKAVVHLQRLLPRYL
jgi:hypothetical protein